MIRQWLENEDIPIAELVTLANLIDLYEANGRIAIEHYIKDLGCGFYGMVVLRKGGKNPCLVFRYGPFDEEGEVTLLAGGFWRNKELRPYYVIGFAKERLEALYQNPNWRRHESIA